MDILKHHAGGYAFELVCSSRSTRNGFAHDCTMFVDGQETGTATRHYLNRTWERYAFQSVALDAVAEQRDAVESRLRDLFKDQRGYMRMNRRREGEFTEWLAGCSLGIADKYRALCNAYDYFDTAHRAA